MNINDLVDLIKEPIANTSSIGEWIKWEGGEECPFDYESYSYSVRFRDGREHTSFGVDGFRWKHLGAMGDIVAYKIIKEIS